MAFALEDKWVWDFWIARDGSAYHMYFLQADKNLNDPDLRHWHVTQGHAVSTDLTNWNYLGTCFAPSSTPAWDDYTTWTGSVVKGNNEKWHLFYTGTSRSEDGKKQRIGHAVCNDLHNWERIGDGLTLDISGPDYEDFTPDIWYERAFRDPWVMRHPEGDGWLMYFTARVAGAEEINAGGCIGFATSPDLYHWRLEKPVFADGMFAHMEVPQVFARDGQWYMLFCLGQQQWSKAYRSINPQEPLTGTHYLIAKTPLGPWRVAPGPFLDGGGRYAGKIIEAPDGGLCYLGFIRHRPGNHAFIGEICDPIPVGIDHGNQLTLGSVDVHLSHRIVAARDMKAAKLVSVLQ